MTKQLPPLQAYLASVGTMAPAALHWKPLKYTVSLIVVWLWKTLHPLYIGISNHTFFKLHIHFELAMLPDQSGLVQRALMPLKPTQ